MARMQNDTNTTTCRVVYYEDELNDEFSDAVIKARTIDESYDYDGGFLRFLGRIFWYYMLVRPFATVFLKVKYHHKIVGKEKLKAAEGTGFFLYGNHTNPVADAFIPSMICKPTGAYEIVHPANVSMPVLGRINPSLGAIPLPDTKGALKGFTKAVDRAIKRKACVAIYPEAHIWPYCTWIRNFREASFRYPVKADKPVFCFVNTYHKGRGNTPKMITYVEGPFFADKTLPPKDQKKELRDQVYTAMCKAAENNTVELVKYIKKDESGTQGDKT
ncbi:MAG: hypothetical protein J5626_03995 [Lachnospiraceae bacterium]|nr:hypothetical protein [Lachnospiraceae bacterium]